MPGSNYPGLLRKGTRSPVNNVPVSIVSACTSPTQRGQAARGHTHGWPSCRENPRSSPCPPAIPVTSEDAGAGDFVSARSSPHPAHREMQTPALAALRPEHPDAPSKETTAVWDSIYS